MSGFIASGTHNQFVIDNDGWWPDIDGNEVRSALRLDSSVTNDRLKAAACAAIVAVNRELARVKLGHRVSGVERLEDVGGDLVGGESHLLMLYRRAVACLTGAELCERYRSYDTTAAGGRRADELVPSIDEYRRDARWAIRDILGISRTTVELL